eukprot:7472371-Lingulodinium_polyedra.AAC.1
MAEADKARLDVSGTKSCVVGSTLGLGKRAAHLAGLCGVLIQPRACGRDLGADCTAGGARRQPVLKQRSVVAKRK